MGSELTIGARFCGPPTSANGGYAAGLLAERSFAADEAVVVTLRAPPPLDKALTVSDGKLLDGETLLAEAKQGALDLSVPEPVSFAEAQAAAERYIGRSHHIYPRCFVCGPSREAGDGMCLEPGLVEGHSAQSHLAQSHSLQGDSANDHSAPQGNALVAAPWQVDGSLPTADGRVTIPVMWAALDCPGYFGFAAPLRHKKMVLLGRITAQISGRPAPGDRCIVTGWLLEQQGRKIHTGSAVFTEAGVLLACAKGTWIELRDK